MAKKKITPKPKSAKKQVTIKITTSLTQFVVSYHVRNSKDFRTLLINPKKTRTFYVDASEPVHSLLIVGWGTKGGKVTVEYKGAASDNAKAEVTLKRIDTTSNEYIGRTLFYLD